MSLFISGGSFLLKEKDRFHSLKKVLTGRFVFSSTLEFEKKTYPFIFGHIETGSYVGYESFYNPTIILKTHVQALGDASYEEVNFANLNTANAAVLCEHLYHMTNNIASLAESFINLQKMYGLIHRLNSLLLGLSAYVVDHFNFNVKNKEIKNKAKMVYDLLKTRGLSEELLPLSKAVIAFDFSPLQEHSLSKYKTNVLFASRFKQIFPNLRKVLLEKDEVFTRFILENLAVKHSPIIEGIKTIMDLFLEELDLTIGKDGLLDAFVSFIEQATKNQQVANSIRNVANEMLKYYQSNIITKISDFSINLQQEIERAFARFNFSNTIQVQVSGSSQNNKQGNASFNNTVEHILAYAQLDEAKYKNFIMQYNKWKMLPVKLSYDDEVRAIRKRVTELFWEIYANCFVNYKIKGRPLTQPVELMFRYGFFDETMLDNSIIEALLRKKQAPFSDKLKIFDTFEWLNLIAEGKIEPSLDATGEPYTNFIKEKMRDKSNTGKPIEELDTPEERIRFEIINVIKESSRISHGEISTYSPILMDEQFSSVEAVPSLIMAKEQIAQAFYNLRKLDFSAFFREVRFQQDNIEEFIKREIFPIIVILPNAGKRGMVWQPKEKAKDSPGRFVLSAIQTGDLNRVMMTLFGIYRWELVKDLLGPLWNDLSQLSLTAEYTDYSTGIKKSKDLSEEMKEKVQSEFKKIKNDRDRFVNDYIKWISLEAIGRPGLNKVTRAIFYRQVPFAKEVRDKLSKMPSFAEAHDRYVNMNRKEYMRLKTKYQKYMDKSERLPQELQNYLNFFLM